MGNILIVRMRFYGEAFYMLVEEFGFCGSYKGVWVR